MRNIDLQGFDLIGDVAVEHFRQRGLAFEEERGHAGSWLNHLRKIGGRPRFYHFQGFGGVLEGGEGLIRCS